MVSELFLSELGFGFHSSLYFNRLNILSRMNTFFPGGQHRQIYSHSQMFIVIKANSGQIDRHLYLKVKS